MANYTELPVYLKSFNLLDRLYAQSNNWQKDYRYTLGEDLKKALVDVIKNIYLANSTRDKGQYMQLAREQIEIVRIYARLLHSQKQIPLKDYAPVSKEIEEISIQLSKWHEWYLSQKETAC
ncbi:MAG: four helix bundle protein [Candidatus Symbiothrix sp.]|jgi:four helix bundle protein|nr:four helix bundle protein [Candidatus Symbiothrix sp.]